MPDSFSGPQLVLLGLAILVIGFLLRRSFAQGKRSRERDPAVEAREATRAAERSAESGIRRLEVRLHNYGREIEGRVQTTLTLLDRLIVEAAHESERLGRLLEASGQFDAIPARGAVTSAAAPLNAEDCGMVRELKQAGYTVPQIARLLRRAVEEVQSALRDGEDFDDRPAADAA